MRIYQIDRLNCKRELVMMIIKGNTLREMVEFATKRNEQCSKSAIDRYIKCKFIEGRINEDSSVEIKEKEGHQVRVTKYPSETSGRTQPEIHLLNSMAGF